MENVVKPSLAKDINSYIGGTKVLEIGDGSGQTFNFQIRKVSPILWADSPATLAKSKKTKEDLEKEISTRVSDPSYELLKSVLMQGVVSPRLSEIPSGDEVVDVNGLMNHVVLSLNLYTEIARFSFEELGSLKAEDDARSPAELCS